MCRSLLVSLALSLLVSQNHAAERVLGGDYEIVTAPEANPATMLAAKELRMWFKESTGAELPQVTKPSKDKKHVFLGPNVWSRAAGITADDLKPEGYRLKTVGDDIHIVGVDVHRGSLEPKRTSGTQTGTFSGVIDLLEHCAGIRFFWHDKLGTIVPKNARVVVPDLDITAAPLWKYRWLAYSPEGKCGDDLFARRLRLGHSHTVTHSHAWHQIAPVEKFGKEHPEWFAEIDGVRKPEYYLEHHGGQACTTNTKVIDLFAKAAITYFSEHPERDMFSVSPNDGGGFCTCEKCRALDNGVRADGKPIMTDRLITFYNAIAQQVVAVHPTKLLGAYAYSFYREPPVKVTPHPNLYLVHATNSAFHQGAGWQEEHEMERQWRAGAKHLAKYDIYYSPDSSLNLIAPVTRHLVEKIRSETETGLEGGYLYIGQSYEQLGVGHVLLAKLMWNANAEVEAITADYFAKLYGNAAKDVRAYYEQLERQLAQSRQKQLDTRIPAIRVALRKHPGLGSPAYLLAAYEPVLDETTKLIERAQRLELNTDERARLQRLVDQHELLVTTVRGMFVAARLETEAESQIEDAKMLLELVRRRQAVRAKLEDYAPSLCANLDLGDRAETEALAPQGALVQLARVLAQPRDGTQAPQLFPQGDFEKPVADKLRWSATGGATLTADTSMNHSAVRVQVSEGGTGALTFAIEAKPETSYRITLAHWNDPQPVNRVAGDDADAITRGEPPIAPRTRVIFRDAKGKGVTRNHWSGIAADEHVREWHVFPHLVQTPPGTRSISFTVFLHHPGTYLLDDVKIEELGSVK